MSSRRLIVLACTAAIATGLVPVTGAQTAGAAPAPTVSPTSTPAPRAPKTTPAPKTPAPKTTPAPETPAPKTPSPRTPAPKTPAPKTPAPKTTKPAPKPVPTTTPSKTAHPVLRRGAKGAAVLTLQKRLDASGYWTGKPSGTFDHTTAQAVMALQKVAGLGRDGVVGAATWKALDTARVRPRSTKGRVVEVDLRRQVLVFVVDGKAKYVVNTSTGASRTPTPKGRYRLYRAYDGWRTAPLGRLYRPKYFHQGYAIHGVPDGYIPGYPASHGCARVSMAAMDMMWSKTGLRNGDKVWVY